MPSLIAAYDPYLFVWDGTALYSSNAVPPLAWIKTAAYTGPGVIQEMACAINEVGGYPVLYTVDDQKAVYYYDRVLDTWFFEGTGIWQPPSPPAGGSIAEVGSIKAWPSLTPPASWMLADGSAVSRSLYPALFTLIGTSFGAGDGSTTFNLPDLRGRFVLGAGAGTGLTNRNVADNGGEENHVLSIAELASHTHIQNPHGHTIALLASSARTGTDRCVEAGTQTAGMIANATATNQNTGSGTGHNTMPPFLVVAFIIKVSPSGGATAQAPLADTTQNGLLRQVSGNTTDFVDGTNNCQPIAPQIWSVRLRSFNAVGNPNFEVDQRNVGNVIAGVGNGVFLRDRWSVGKGGTMVVNSGHVSGLIVIPGTNFQITGKYISFQLTTQQGSLGATDNFSAKQIVEGNNWRELSGDVFSLSLLVKNDAALKFSVALRSPDATRSLVKLCTISNPGIWTLITLPNIPVPSGGNFSNYVGNAGYTIDVVLACGSTFMAPAADTWQNGNFVGAPGMDNWASQPVNTNFNIAFIQHEPGPFCTTLIDKPFTQNYDECLRYYCKSYPYGTKGPAASIQAGVRAMTVIANATTNLAGVMSFPKPMAKAPTLSIYAYDGTLNAATIVGGANQALTGAAGGLGELGFDSLSLSTAGTANYVSQFHFIADTGW